ncbi:hypothetical protein CDCA_CDCA08G2331 [Cyanidium caldarium]|uniref:O-acyltransferase n=1 Tax=Cyanidium caldarium TaxID=2771 RepID=A0AAV9IW73_CYACA|nr:hypothetical protein CDCA_CDCA08G2331 [Cyanidium caldarium]
MGNDGAERLGPVPASGRELERARVTRPSIYPSSHASQPRGLLLETVMDRNLLTELKSGRLEGFYNLSFLLLGFALFYMTLRSVVEKGLRVDLTGVLFRCPSLPGDLAFAMLFSVALWSYSTLFFGLVRVLVARTRGRLLPVGAAQRGGGPVSHLLYVMLQAVLYYECTSILWRRETTPALSGFLTLWVITVSLKVHSYFLTNVHLAEEAIRKWREQAASKKEDASAAPESSSSSSSSSSLADWNEEGDGAAAPNTASESASPAAPSTAAPRPEPQALLHTPTLRIGFRRAAHHHRLQGFPENVTFGDFMYFMAAPTLVYEIGYPRTDRVRTRYVLRMALTVLVCIALQIAIMQQFMLPVLQGESAGYSIVYHAAKLAIPSIFVWLLGFFWFFHCALSAWAELLRFADRQFYRDWWNATTLDSFWNKWNMLVHEWALRHVFIELQYRSTKVSKSTAGLATFFVSALLHEYLFAVAFKTITAGIFCGMMVQVPGIYVTRMRYLNGTRRGNMIVWGMLFLGHPLGELLYFRAYLRKHENFFCHAL